MKAKILLILLLAALLTGCDVNDPTFAEEKSIPETCNWIIRTSPKKALGEMMDNGYIISWRSPKNNHSWVELKRDDLDKIKSTDKEENYIIKATNEKEKIEWQIIYGGQYAEKNISGKYVEVSATINTEGDDGSLTLQTTHNWCKYVYTNWAATIKESDADVYSTTDNHGIHGHWEMGKSIKPIGQFCREYFQIADTTENLKSVGHHFDGSFHNGDRLWIEILWDQTNISYGINNYDWGPIE